MKTTTCQKCKKSYGDAVRYCKNCDGYIPQINAKIEATELAQEEQAMRRMLKRNLKFPRR